jgi:hypothetical protein
LTPVRKHFIQKQRPSRPGNAKSGLGFENSSSSEEDCLAALGS